MRVFRISLLIAMAAAPAGAQQWLNADTSKKVNQSNFRSLEDWPAPNEFRSASGAPGGRYWQQKVDYTIRTSLDTVAHAVTGSERMTYHNNSPDKIGYLWLQLDQNVERQDSRAATMTRALPPKLANLSPAALRAIGLGEPFDGGFKLDRVELVDATGGKTKAKYYVNGTALRIDLASPIAAGQASVVEIDWHFNVPENGRNTQRNARDKVKDGWEYEVAQWYPRAAVYDDVNGWQTDQFISQGEFYLEFGDYDVSITVPHDHIVRATGTLMNPDQVLTATQRSRLASAWTSKEPVFIVSPAEVMKPSSRPAGTGPLTWHFTAKNTRDFAWASSKTFIWDAMGFAYHPGQTPIELHSVYPRDGMPLWDKYSTKAIRQTMITYGRMAFEYPYPQASNVHGSVGGMEYPMIAFCGARPRPDGTFDESLPFRLISVTIHEVGHNWFPMIVATDERKWGWMDEGMNSFVEYYGEKDWDKNYPVRRGPAKLIVPYMKDPNQTSLMTETDFVFANYGNQAYSKPAAGLVMLREQLLGPESFDRAFGEYAKRWMFKKPQPADFFRSMAQGAGEQLNYFWRGWFYTTYANDQAIKSVETQNARDLVGTESKGKFYNRITVQQLGGLVLPIIMDVTFDDGSKQRIKLPADTWRFNEREFPYGFFSDKGISGVVLDPDEALADINRDNNTWKKPAPLPIP